MKCKHEASTNLIWRTDDMQYAFFTRDRRKGLGASWFGAVYGAAGREPDARWCPSCGAWLSLGPSNDADPNVQIEIRAAEIADGLNPHGDDFDPSDYTFGESVGWYIHYHGDCSHPLVNYGADVDAWDGAAGYLARCIATHDEEG